jgi:hypothetical protein
VPFISVLSDPTTGGVFASFAALGDINVAEPNALIGFAGARVTSGTIAQELPPGFQRSEFLFEHGFLDRVVHRSELRAELAALLSYLLPESGRNGTGDEPEPLGLPSFRPLSFLSNLAERVMPAEPWPPPATNGHEGADAPKPTSKTAIPAPASAALAGPAPAEEPSNGTGKTAEPAADAAPAEPNAPTEPTHG